jgi:hypothetical protein
VVAVFASDLKQIDVLGTAREQQDFASWQLFHQANSQIDP